MEAEGMDSSLSQQYLDGSQPSTSSSLYVTNTMENNYGPNLNSLPDELLLHLISYLNTSDLYRLSRCNRRIYELCSDRKFWREVYDVCNGSLPLHIRLRQFFNDSTASLYLSQSTGTSSNRPAKDCENLCFKNNFLESLRSLSNLKTFILENHTFTRLNLMYLPESLTQLILNRINLLNKPEQNEIFNDIHTSLPNLEIVDVSHCSWVTPDLLLPLSRCPNLKKIVMIECTNMRNITFYADIATNSGFSQLKALDLRLTYVTFDEISIFQKLTNLKHILLEKPAEGRMETVTRNLKMAARMFHSILTSLNQPLISGALPVHNAFPVGYADFHTTFRITNYVNTWLETLVVRNYSDITDLTLGEIEAFFKSIKYLDITGTGCTAERVAIFQIRCPEVKVLHDSITEITELLIDLNL